MSTPWVHISEHNREAREYIDKRRSGEVQSFRTPWDVLNNECINGLEFNSVYLLAAPSGAGKTTFALQLTREGLILNQNIKPMILDLQFEMNARTGVLRSLSRTTGKSIKELSSAFEVLNDSDYNNVINELDKTQNDDIFIVDIPCSVPIIEQTVRSFYNTYKRPFVVTLDHSILVPRSTEKDEWEVIRTLAKMLIKTKKELPIIWLVLNQLNRDYESVDRQTPNNLKAFIQKADVFGGDSLWFASDMVIGQSKPSTYLPLGTFYGPKGYDIRVTEDLIVWHILKNRVDEPGKHLIMKSHFAQMKIIEA